MFERYKNYFLLHIIVFIWGFTGILGKLIEAESTVLVWYRMLIAFIGLFIYLSFKNRASLRISWSDFGKFLPVGLIIALHWITFFEAIKVSNVSVALACMSTVSFFTALIEPLFYKRRIIGYELLLSLGVIAGLYLIFKFEPKYVHGIVLALVSSFLSAVFTVFNGILVRKSRASTITFYEMVAGFIGIGIFLFGFQSFQLSDFAISYSDFGWILILGLVCTAFAFVVSVHIMKELTPFTVAIAVNLEPVYAIILALFIFGESEKMTTNFYIGAIIILATVVLNTVIKKVIRSKAKTS